MNLGSLVLLGHASYRVGVTWHACTGNVFLIAVISLTSVFILYDSYKTINPFFCSSFNSISREFYFATSAGLLLWLGLLSLQYLVCFFPNINVFSRNISFWQFCEEHKHFRVAAFLWRAQRFRTKIFCCSASVLDCLSDCTCHFFVAC